MAEIQKEKVGFYKTLLTLSWTTFVVLSGGIYKLFTVKQYDLLILAWFGVIILFGAIIFCILKTQKWIKKMEIKKL